MKQSTKQKIRDRFDNQCFMCGRRRSGRKPLHIHHINGDDSDNRDENLVLMCASCHISCHRKDVEPYRPFHRALPPEHRHCDNVYEGGREPLTVSLRQSRITRWIDTDLMGHRYRKRDEGWHGDKIGEAATDGNGGDDDE